MRYASWGLGIAGVLQYTIIVAMDATDYVSLDMSYLVMWLAVIAALALCYASCCGYGSGDDCGCCGDNCNCGDCGACGPGAGKHDAGHAEHSHEGHSH